MAALADMALAAVLTYCLIFQTVIAAAVNSCCSHPQKAALRCKPFFIYDN